MFLNNRARLIPPASFSPYENMAIDEYLIEYYEKTSRPVLRLYSWKPAGLSIGRNQDAQKEINLEKCASRSVPVVRRLTGGGAIYHKNELTYSVVLSENDLSKEPLTVKGSFEKLNAFIIRMYSKFGLKAAYARDIAVARTNFGGRSPFCFAANEEYDIMIGGKKIGGNAQMRKKNIIFQHGSIPLEETSEAPGFVRGEHGAGNYTFLNTVLGRKVYVEEAAANLIAAFMEEFGADLKEEPLVMDEKKRVVEILTSRYALNNWNLKKMNK
jgi:lipoate-protein ligase A